MSSSDECKSCGEQGEIICGDCLPFFPDECESCKTPIPRGKDLCRECVEAGCMSYACQVHYNECKEYVEQNCPQLLITLKNLK